MGQRYWRIEDQNLGLSRRATKIWLRRKLNLNSEVFSQKMTKGKKLASKLLSGDGPPSRQRLCGSGSEAFSRWASFVILLKNSFFNDISIPFCMFYSHLKELLKFAGSLLQLFLSDFRAAKYCLPWLEVVYNLLQF